MSDNNIVTSPSHYTRLAISPAEYNGLNRLGFNIGNAVKYVSRAGHKLYPGMDELESTTTDLRKAMVCTKMQINMLEGKPVDHNLHLIWDKDDV